MFYPHTDRQGSVIALSGARMAQSQWSYGPYGETPDAVGTAPRASSYGYRYTGQRYDSDFGLYDYKARTYSPALGRFLQPDPAGLGQGPNLYGYVLNDPLGAEDPTGMACRSSRGCDPGGGDFVDIVVGPTAGTAEDVDESQNNSRSKGPATSQKTGDRIAITALQHVGKGGYGYFGY